MFMLASEAKTLDGWRLKCRVVAALDVMVAYMRL